MNPDKVHRIRLALKQMNRWLVSTWAKPSYEWPKFDVTSRVMTKMVELAEEITGSTDLVLTARGIQELRREE